MFQRPYRGALLGAGDPVVASACGGLTDRLQSNRPTGTFRVAGTGARELERDAERLIEKLPADKKEEAPQVAENLEMLVKQATNPKPNRKWYSVSAEGLLEASKWVKDFTGDITGTVGKLGRLLWPDFSLPEVERIESKGGDKADD